MEAQEPLRSGTKAVLMSPPDCRSVPVPQEILTQDQREEVVPVAFGARFPFVHSTVENNLLRILNFKLSRCIKETVIFCFCFLTPLAHSGASGNMYTGSSLTRN